MADEDPVDTSALDAQEPLPQPPDLSGGALTPLPEAAPTAEEVHGLETAGDLQPEPEVETYDVAWAEARRSRMHALVRENPEAALAEALTPRRFAALPAEIQALVERPVADEGFYGVLAVCGHGPNEDHIEGACEIRHEVVLNFGTFDAEGFQASIYGTRHQRMTEESASIYGVVVDGHMALHEDDVVVVDDGEGFPGGRYAVYYRGEEWTTDDLDAANARRDSLLGE